MLELCMYFEGVSDRICRQKAGGGGGYWLPLRHERALPFIQALLLYPPSFLIPANNSGVRSYSAWVSGDSAVDNLSCVFLSSLLRINAVEGGIKVLCDTLWVTWGAFPPAQGLLLFYIHPCSCLSTNLLCTFFHPKLNPTEPLESYSGISGLYLPCRDLTI